jgi:hypothetical protein
VSASIDPPHSNGLILIVPDRDRERRGIFKLSQERTRHLQQVLDRDAGVRL